jgi:hypothetical protein
METDESPLEKSACGQFSLFPSVIISITDYKSGEDEEEIYSHITMIEPLVQRR